MAVDSLGRDGAMATAILQARMSSTRLPGKVMRPILGEPMIGRQIERVRRAERLTGLLIATSTDPSDDVIEDYAEQIDAECFRGSLDDVLARFIGALDAAGNPKTFLRLTADCPLADWRLIDLCIARHEEAGADCTHNGPGWTYPKGLDIEVCESAALRRAAREATSAYDREHVTPYIYARPEVFRIATVTARSATALPLDRRHPRGFRLRHGGLRGALPRKPRLHE